MIKRNHRLTSDEQSDIVNNDESRFNFLFHFPFMIRKNSS